MNSLDPNNLVVKLCIEGMQAEGEERHVDAHALFQQAWEVATDDFERAIAAHYLARHQEQPEEMLYWNQEALNRALAVDHERVRDFFPSLYLNLGWSYERLGDLEKARSNYDLAAERIADLPPSDYTEVVRRGVTAGQKRTTPLQDC